MSSRIFAKSNQSVTPRALGWGIAAAVGACAACCALPLLATGIGGGVLAALAGMLRPGMDLLVGGGVGLAVTSALVLRNRARSRAASQGAIGSSCGCTTEKPNTLLATPKPDADEPILCTANLSDGPTVKGQMDGYQSAFRYWLRTERLEHGFRWVFTAEPGLDAQLKLLMQNESECCRFFEFELQRSDNELIWVTRGSAAAASVVDEFATLPARLREHGTDDAGIRTIKGHAETAGLVFSADRT